MHTMKAVRIHAYGGPKELVYVDSGRLKAVVETVLPLSEARHAHELRQAACGARSC
jgi:hypothetical protein